jgi:hypothetical protein
MLRTRKASLNESILFIKVKFMSTYHKKALCYSLGGMLAAILAAWMMLIVHYPALLNVHGKFGPDAEHWIIYAAPLILFAIMFAAFVGAFGGYGVCIWRTKIWRRL